MKWLRMVKPRIDQLIAHPGKAIIYRKHVLKYEVAKVSLPGALFGLTELAFGNQLFLCNHDFHSVHMDVASNPARKGWVKTFLMSFL